MRADKRKRVDIFPVGKEYADSGTIIVNALADPFVMKMPMVEVMKPCRI